MAKLKLTYKNHKCVLKYASSHTLKEHKD